MTTKLRKALLLFAIALSLMSVEKMMAQPAGCLCLPWYDSIVHRDKNLDSLKIDSCGFVDYQGDCKGVITNFHAGREAWLRKLYYSKRNFSIFFSERFFNPPIDTVGARVVVTWRDLDSIHQDLRDSLEKLEQLTGTFVLVKKHPYDTVSEMSQSYRVEFENYVKASDVDSAFKSSSEGKYTFSFSKWVYDEEPAGVRPWVQQCGEVIEVSVNGRESIEICKSECGTIQIFNVLGQLVERYEIPEGIRSTLISLKPGAHFLKTHNQIIPFCVGE